MKKNHIDQTLIVILLDYFSLEFDLKIIFFVHFLTKNILWSFNYSYPINLNSFTNDFTLRDLKTEPFQLHF